jgi:hypothetical protein
MLFAFFLGDLENLTIDHVCAAYNAQNCHDRYEDSAGSHPAIQIETDEKTETNAAGHGKADLQNDGEVLSPSTVFFIVEHRSGLSMYRTPGVLGRPIGCGLANEAVGCFGTQRSPNPLQFMNI